MERIKEFLKEKEKNNLLRVLRPADSRKEGLIYIKGKKYIDFCSNDYLGLSEHPAIKDISKETLEKFGTSSSASRLLSGDLALHHELEEKIASFKSKEDALIFNTGYQANVGVISALSGRRDVVFSDKLNHASIIDGIVLSGAKLFRFFHNDTVQLESLLKRERHKFKGCLIITESVFSMDGDKAPLKRLASLAKEYNSKFMVDEAHATGIFGENGSGLVEEQEISDKVDIVMGTFSKALGSFGAYIACSTKIKEYLINTCRSFIYSTALPPSVIAANIKSLELVKNEPIRRKTLLENSDYLRENLKKHGFKIKSSSQIIPLLTQESDRAVKLSEKLRERGHWVLPIRPPTVPRGESRLRFSLTYHHTKDMLEGLISDTVEASKEF